jgi:hypothetical protein
MAESSPAVMAADAVPAAAAIVGRKGSVATDPE